MKSLQKIIIAIFLISMTSCIGSFDAYQIVNTKPNYQNLKNDEKIVFHEINFVKMIEIKNPNQTLSILEKNLSFKDDFWLKYSILDDKNKVTKKIILSFRQDQIYPQKILADLYSSTRQNIKADNDLAPNYDQKIAYFTIKNNERVRFDSLSFMARQNPNQKIVVSDFTPNKEIFFSSNCHEKMCFLGSYLIIANQSLENSSANLKILPIKTSDDFFNAAQKLMKNPPALNFNNFKS